MVCLNDLGLSRPVRGGGSWETGGEIAVVLNAWSIITIFSIQ
jgi:hypothetical protein